MSDGLGTGKRLKRLRLHLLGIRSQAEFARPLGVTRGAVGNWERGEGIKTENIRKIADHYGASFEWLSTGRGEPMSGALTTPLTKSVTLGTVPIRGIVQAGNWQDIDRWGAEEMTEYVASSAEYPLEWQYGLRVHGQSLNRIAKDGDTLICLDLIKSQAEIRDGDLVIVERARAGGQFVERTAKRIRQTMHGAELWPESDDPNFQEKIEYHPDGDPEHNSVEVVAKVLFILRVP